MRRRALAVAAYLAGLALFVELALRLALAIPALFHRIEGPDDASWRLEWVKRHAKGGGHYAGLDAFSPTRGWALRADLRELPAFGTRVSSNSKGLRGRREYAYERTPGTTRIVVLGDSFSFGEEVGDDETYSRRLEASLPGAEVLNLGVHGYGHDQMLIYLREEGVRYRPDVVLLGFVAEDMNRNLLGFRDFAKPRFVLEDGRLALRGSPVPTPEDVLRIEPFRSRIADVATMLRQRVRARSGAERSEKRQLTRAILDEMKASIEAAGARPVYVYLPEHKELARRTSRPSRRERFLLAYCRQRAMACIDLAPVFHARARSGAALKTKGHWDALEHAVGADAIGADLLARDLLRAPSG